MQRGVGPHGAVEVLGPIIRPVIRDHTDDPGDHMSSEEHAGEDPDRLSRCLVLVGLRDGVLEWTSRAWGLLMR